LVLHGADARATAVHLPMLHQGCRIEPLIINKWTTVTSLTVRAGRNRCSRFAAMVFVAICRVVVELFRIVTSAHRGKQTSLAENTGVTLHPSSSGGTGAGS